MLDELLNDGLPNEIRAPLPASLQGAQNSAKALLIDYLDRTAAPPQGQALAGMRFFFGADA